MVLLDDVVEIFWADYTDLYCAPEAAEYLADLFDTCAIGATLIDYDPQWNAIVLQCLREEQRCGSCVTTLRQHETKGFAITINGTIEVCPFPTNLDVWFVSHLAGHCRAMSREGTRHEMAVGRFRFCASNAIKGENLTTHLLSVAWSTIIPRSAVISSRSRNETEFRR